MRLYYLVDGIYPWLLRFLQSIKDPTSRIGKTFAGKQEAARKDVERAFGVWKGKFLSVGTAVKFHKRDDIFFLVMTTIIMHNMMVEYRVSRNEEESDDLYDAVSNNQQSSSSSTVPDGEESREEEEARNEQVVCGNDSL